MKERPIIFSGEMVKAILKGRKTQTRRVIVPQPEIVGDHVITCLHWKGRNCGSVRGNGQDWLKTQCPYGQPRDRLWVRERHYFYYKDFEHAFEPRYYADASEWELQNIRTWKPSIHMPRWASRILLEITDVRAERLQHISGQDIKAEGLDVQFTIPGSFDALDRFRTLWNSLNAKRHPWEGNWWVWVISFRQISMELGV